jgi:predicted glycosyltransferase
MNVSYYCQHVLGIGHLHRSIEICKAIARRHPTTLIVGGPPVHIDQPELQLLELPGLQMDNEFNTMKPCRSDLSLDETKTARKRLLFDHFQTTRPDIFITELYPFGRKAFRFELDPLLAAISDGSLPPCSCYCSVRDILVEKKTGREKFERRAVETINAYFDGILVHADPRIITLDETFGRLTDISIPLRYTGFVTKPKVRHKVSGERNRIRKRLALSPADKLIVASIGGGNVGTELLEATVQAFNILENFTSSHLQLFCGPYCDEPIYKTLRKSSQENISIDRFTDHFPEWLEAADVSISMAGYNTCMNLVQAGIPALVYPFKQNREQRLRAERFGREMAMTILTDTDLTPPLLARKMMQQLDCPRSIADINLDGAQETVRQIEIWYQDHSQGAVSP